MLPARPDARLHEEVEPLRRPPLQPRRARLRPVPRQEHAEAVCAAHRPKKDEEKRGGGRDSVRVVFLPLNASRGIVPTHRVAGEARRRQHHPSECMRGERAANSAAVCDGVPSEVRRPPPTHAGSAGPVSQTRPRSHRHEVRAIRGRAHHLRGSGSRAHGVRVRTPLRHVGADAAQDEVQGSRGQVPILRPHLRRQEHATRRAHERRLLRRNRRRRETGNGRHEGDPDDRHGRRLRRVGVSGVHDSLVRRG